MQLILVHLLEGYANDRKTYWGLLAYTVRFQLLLGKDAVWWMADYQINYLEPNMMNF